MTRLLTTIGFDADDTLWQNETFFRLTQDRFTRLLADYAAPDHLHDRLLAAETRNLGSYGFGIKGFVLSMIETAIEVTEGRVPAPVIAEIMAAGREMLEHPIELLPHARAAVESLAEKHRVILITKGDLLDQERKLAQSGLGELFHGVEIVSQKTAQVYARVFARHGDGVERALMVGNSLKSDVLPVIEAGGWGVHVPHGLTWALESAEPPAGHRRFRELPDLGGLPALVAALEGDGAQVVAEQPVDPRSAAQP
ncbi:MAG: HAD family hydrolase [Cereibacter changlensis]|uniref:HAD family hydrolase n=2 Tax=Cereibacter changlensis TaxID=402884 RepID=A0A2T4JXQ7_9RHOB|nr:HAD family hydrolase [Cereibacter changlensis]PTE22577.1 HAD family hydrolase [Cereibacter changlensis JA139]PZX50800.1 putative hydrolase of the HAD superfamily [Cereibacter changlensis]